jgi:transposase InsO family protein
VDRLFREANSRDDSITRSDVEEFLSGELAYTLHRRVVRKFTRNPIIANHHGELAQADLIDIQKLSKENGGYNYILTLIDVFSKYAFAVPIMRKTAAQMSKALNTILQSYRPSNLQTDEGTEFTNVQVQRLLKDHLVHFYLAKNERIKCAVIERFQRTIMTRINKYLTSKGTNRFIGLLPQFMEAYNNSYHRSIRMSPIQAMNAPSSVVFKNLYGYESHRDMLLKMNRRKSKKKLGDTVRIPEQKNKFAKGYSQNFTDEIYTVNNVNSGAKVPVYQLKDYKGNVIKGNYYPEEIQVVRNSDLYRVIVLREKGRGKRKQYLVKYANFDLEPEWIPAANLQDLS